MLKEAQSLILYQSTDKTAATPPAKEKPQEKPIQPVKPAQPLKPIPKVPAQQPVLGRKNWNPDARRTYPD